MPASPAIDDLFGHVPQHGNGPTLEPARAKTPDELARDQWPGYVVPYADTPKGGHTADSIRAHVVKVMAVVREATATPFGAEELRTYNAMMPYLCEWLKNGEGDALLAEYRGIMERLAAT